ncbi:hypothetical protein U1Q18_044415 [Sarracenia purpurea var. burkii]
MHDEQLVELHPSERWIGNLGLFPWVYGELHNVLNEPSVEQPIALFTDLREEFPEQLIKAPERSIVSACCWCLAGHAEQPLLSDS